MSTMRAYIDILNENPVEEAPEDEINKMKQTATSIEKGQSMMKPRYMSRIASMVEDEFEAIRDAALKRYKKANGEIDLYTAYTMAIEDEFPEIPNPGLVFQYMTDPLDPNHQDLVPQDAEDGSWADRADKEYQQNPKGGGFDPLIKGRWFAIRRDRDSFMDQGMEPEDALDKAAERHGVDPEEVEKWLAAGNAVKMKERKQMSTMRAYIDILNENPAMMGQDPVEMIKTQITQKEEQRRNLDKELADLKTALTQANQQANQMKMQQTQQQTQQQATNMAANTAPTMPTMPATPQQNPPST